MAGRQNKVGLDYFELDCHMDEKIKLIEAEFGLKGFAIIVKLYQSIYSGFGYYCEWTPDISLLWAMRLGVSHGGGSKGLGRTLEEGFLSGSKGRLGNALDKSSLPGFPDNLINGVVAASIRRDIFSRELFEKYHILTSSGIQKRYLNAVSKREKVEVKKEYLLFSIPKNRINVVINSIYDGRNSISAGRNEQSKVEKSKEDISSVATPAEPKQTTVAFDEQSFEIKCVDILIDSCLKTFPNSKVPQTLSEKQKWAIEIDRMKRLDGRTEVDIMSALNYAVSDSFWQGNIRSTKKFREKFETLIVRSRTKSKQNSNNKFKQFEQRDYDFNSIEEKLLSRK